MVFIESIKDEAYNIYLGDSQKYITWFLQKLETTKKEKGDNENYTIGCQAVNCDNRIKIDASSITEKENITCSVCNNSFNLEKLGYKKLNFLETFNRLKEEKATDSFKELFEGPFYILEKVIPYDFIVANEEFKLNCTSKPAYDFGITDEQAQAIWEAGWNPIITKKARFEQIKIELFATSENADVRNIEVKELHQV